MKVGKIPPDKLKELVLNKSGKRRSEVLVHSGLGEDSAVVDLQEGLLVISSDPITGADSNAGYLAVHVACNDIAAAGAEPIGIQVILLLPPTITDREIADLMEEIDQTAGSIDVEILGGHTEVLSAVSKPIITITAVGRVERDRYVTSSGACPGDDLVITKGLGIEGTYILANDYRDLLCENGISDEMIDKAARYGELISVIKEGRIAAGLGADAMHDVTEGGLYGALEELAEASGYGFELERENLLVSDETREITSVLGIDPAGLLSSGSMLIAIPDGEQLITVLSNQGIRAAKIGRIIEQGQFIVDQTGKREGYQRQEKDELWRFME